MSSATELVRADARAVLQCSILSLEPLRGGRIFITGGTGFLGVWLIELLAVLNEDHGFAIQVIVYSRNCRALTTRWPHLGGLNWLSFQEGDIRYLAEIPRDVNLVIHAAALADRRLSASQPSIVAETNSLGTARALKAAAMLDRLEKFLLVSSSLVYGAQPWNHPQISEDFAGSLRCDDVNSVYAESKRMAEVFAHSAMSENKLPVVVVRPFAFVGPYQSLNLPWAVTDFIRDSLKGGPIRIMGDGSAVRSLLYASDYAHWVLVALARGTPRSTYNIGNPEGIDLLSLAKLTASYFQPSPEIFTNLGAGHVPTILVPSVAKAQSELGLSVTVNVASALQKTITWNRLTHST